MARIPPLVLVSGEPQRLQAGDSLVGACVVSVGTTNPNDANGNDGDIYFNETQGDVWNKQAGHWVFYGANAYFFQGVPLDSSMVTPSNGNVPTYDAGTGSWKSAAPAGSSLSGMDDETKARLNLAIL